MCHDDKAVSSIQFNSAFAAATIARIDAIQFFHYPQFNLPPPPPSHERHDYSPPPASDMVSAPSSHLLQQRQYRTFTRALAYGLKDNLYSIFGFSSNLCTYATCLSP